MARKRIENFFISAVGAFAWNWVNERAGKDISTNNDDQAVGGSTAASQFPSVQRLALNRASNEPNYFITIFILKREKQNQITIFSDELLARFYNYANLLNYEFSFKI